MKWDMSPPLRDVFGETLVNAGTENEDVVVLDADLAGATRSIFFGRKFPHRFYDVGITEANMVSIGAGLSTCGKIPYVCTFSFLLTLRAADQIRSQISYPGLNVKLMGTNGGLSGYGDGVTHQSIMDLAIMRAMPNFTVIVPSDSITLQHAVFDAMEINGPVFIRVPRVEAPIIHPQNTKMDIGKGFLLREGTDVTIVAMGMMVSYALQAAEELEKEDISCEVLEIHTLKPIDTQLLVHSISKTGAAVSVEEHSRYGGLTSAVAEIVGHHHPVPLESVAIEDRFGGSGQYTELLEECGLTVSNIIRKVKSAIRRKITVTEKE